MWLNVLNVQSVKASAVHLLKPVPAPIRSQLLLEMNVYGDYLILSRAH